MNSNKEWERMVRGGECLTVEYKRMAPKLERLARSFSAFSNSAGGTIFFGVDDDGTLRGLEHLSGTRELVETVAQFHCDPPVQPRTHVWEVGPSVQILVTVIPEAEIKPVYAVDPNNPKDAWPFFRSAQENLALDKKSIKSMRRKPSTDIAPDELDKLDRHTISILNKLKDKPRQTVSQLAKSSNISSHRAKKILVNLERHGWIHGFFNEKRREFSLTVEWKKK